MILRRGAQQSSSCGQRGTSRTSPEAAAENRKNELSTTPAVVVPSRRTCPPARFCLTIELTCLITTGPDLLILDRLHCVHMHTLTRAQIWRALSCRCCCDCYLKFAEFVNAVQKAYYALTAIANCENLVKQPDRSRRECESRVTLQDFICARRYVCAAGVWRRRTPIRCGNRDCRYRNWASKAIFYVGTSRQHASTTTITTTTTHVDRES